MVTTGGTDRRLMASVSLNLTDRGKHRGFSKRRYYGKGSYNDLRFRTHTRQSLHLSYLQLNLTDQVKFNVYRYRYWSIPLRCGCLPHSPTDIDVRVEVFWPIYVYDPERTLLTLSPVNVVPRSILFLGRRREGSGPVRGVLGSGYRSSLESWIPTFRTITTTMATFHYIVIVTPTPTPLHRYCSCLRLT